MFLKTLKIENGKSVIRNITFYKGVNLIVDETKSDNTIKSGNNVGKTTVHRLIDFCLGGDGDNIYMDPEFKKKSYAEIEKFLTNNNIVITLILKEDLNNNDSLEIVIRKNFLKNKKKIQEINGEKFSDRDFPKKLKELIFKSNIDKPSFRYIVSKNIRYEKNKLLNTIKVLHPHAKESEYESLYLFWLGIEMDNNKSSLIKNKKNEEDFQKRLRKDNNKQHIEQALPIVKKQIEELSKIKEAFDLNPTYSSDISNLNNLKSNINKLSTEISALEMRKNLILESKHDLESEFSKIDSQIVKSLYEEAKVLIPQIQKTFEETIEFHNQMTAQKIKYITHELPKLEKDLLDRKNKISKLLDEENFLTKKLKKSNTVENIEVLITKLNKAYEDKGKLEEQKRLWIESEKNLENINSELNKINDKINSQETLIKERITLFNIFFPEISEKLDGEKFLLSFDKVNDILKLDIANIHGNLGTGKKKGQIAAFDIAYIKFADSINIKCLHFILHDQIENIHGNQISNLLTEIANKSNCQYILPVLKDKLPNDVLNNGGNIILKLSEDEKFFKI